MQKKVFFILGFLVLVIGLLAPLYFLQADLLARYRAGESSLIRDRKEKRVALLPNERGYFSSYLDKVPPDFKKLLIEKEDRYFYYHPGFNPGSILQNSLSYLGLGSRQGASTITQQLVKVLLEKEKERTLKNKMVEALCTLSLEIYHPKEEIITMYSNSVYFGNRAQGLSEASRLYFNLPPELLTEGQILQLLSTTSRPSDYNPGEPRNKEIARALTRKMNVSSSDLELVSASRIRENMKEYHRFHPAYFEIKPFLKEKEARDLTCDLELTEKIREVIRRNVRELGGFNVNNAAAVVIKIPENEVLALVGSPDPSLSRKGYKINMLNEPRPIGSTIKPFLYLKAFEKGLRPYTLVQDREYKYITAVGLPLYPKNFDYKYRGEVTLHYALSNSLNVPAVKVLEFVGLPSFYSFLREGLGLEPVQPLDNYQLGIALGALEEDLYHLASYFTLFARKGKYGPPVVVETDKKKRKEIVKEKYIQLVNKVLSDRRTGVAQFGMVSNLNLSQGNYALKTGTSRDFRDSWVIGYTPDFVVGVWVGNADNTPTKKISGQVGAGRIWSETMELLFSSSYNEKTSFDFDLIKKFQNQKALEYGLPADNYKKARRLLKKKEKALILTPHSGDTFILEEETRIPLRAEKSVTWFVNETLLGEGREEIFSPSRTGSYLIKAKREDREEKITIQIRK